MSTLRTLLGLAVAPSVVLGALTLAAAAMLVATPWPPGMDWAHQTALVDILARWLQGDAAIRAAFAPHLQPVGYHGFFVAAVPLALLVGAQAATHHVMAATLVAHVAVCGWAARRVRAPWTLAAVGLPLFFGPHYVWGFLVVLFAMPFSMVALTLLLQARADGRRAGRRHVVAAALASAAAVVSHVVLAPVLVAAAGLTLFAVPARRHVALAALGGTALAAAPGAVATLWRMAHAPAGPAPLHTSWTRGLFYLSQEVRSVDASWALAGASLLWGLLAALAAGPRRAGAAARTPRWPLFALAAGIVAGIWAIPVETFGAVGSAYLLNTRALVLLPYVLLLLAADSALLARRSVRALVHAAALVSAVCTLWGVHRLGRTYHDEVADWLVQAERLPRGGALAVLNVRLPLAHAWPPVLQNMATTAFAGRLGWQSGLFVDGHTPVRAFDPTRSARAEAAARGMMAALQPSGPEAVAAPEGGADAHANGEALGPGAQDGAAQRLWREADVLFVQHDEAGPGPPPPEHRAVLLGQGRHWRLFGPPRLPLPASTIVPWLPPAPLDMYTGPCPSSVAGG